MRVFFHNPSFSCSFLSSPPSLFSPLSLPLLLFPLFAPPLLSPQYCTWANTSGLLPINPNSCSSTLHDLVSAYMIIVDNNDDYLVMKHLNVYINDTGYTNVVPEEESNAERVRDDARGIMNERVAVSESVRKSGEKTRERQQGRMVEEAVAWVSEGSLQDWAQLVADTLTAPPPHTQQQQ